VSQINMSCHGSTHAGRPTRHGGSVAWPIGTALPPSLGMPASERAPLHRAASSSRARPSDDAGASNGSQNAAAGRPQPGGPGSPGVGISTSSPAGIVVPQAASASASIALMPR
jgi:hypothetical protein